MKYSKLTYDLNGSAYQPKQLAVPTDSTYAIGVEFIKDGTRINGEVDNYKLIDGENEISATTTLNGMGIFELTSTSDVNDDKTFSVKYHSEKQPDFDVVLSTAGSSTGWMVVFNSYVALSDLTDIDDFNPNNIKVGANKATEEKAIEALADMSLISQFAASANGKTYPVVFNNSSMTDANAKYQYGMSDTGNVGWVEYSQSKYGQYIHDSDFVDVSIQDMIDDGCLYMRFAIAQTVTPLYTAVRYGEYELVGAKFDGLQINQVDDGNREIDIVGGVER